MATLDEMMQAMSGKPTAASRSREFDHQQFNPNVFGADALKEWLKGVKERTLHPLEALAKYSQDFQKMSPVDQGLQLTGGGLAGTFAGVGAKTANLAKLELAQKLKQQGVPDREIYSKTGWTFGFPDSKPRFEIPDNLATMSSKPLPSEYIESVGVNEPSWKVGQVLDHSGLFSAYPDLKSIRSSFMYGQPESANYKPGMDWISYNAESMKKAVPSIKQQAIIDAHEAYTKAFYDRPDVKAWNDATDSFNFNQPNVDDAFKALSQKYGGSEIDDEAARLAQKSLDFRSLAGGGYALRGAKSPTLHELQHAIQQREGFARGGSPDNFQQLPQSEVANIKDLFNRQWEYADSLPKGSDEELVASRELARLSDLLASPHDKYRRLAGEAEARLTQARMNMTPEQRAASYPIDMFDVPVNEQIVRYGEGNALSLPKTQKEPLFDTSGLPNRGRDLIQSKAEEYAQKMRDSGVNVIDVHHSGSAAGPSSYIKVQGYPDIRISGHSKGVWGTQNVVNVGSDSLFDEVLSKIPKTVRFGSPEEIAAILSKQKEEEIATMYPIRIKSAEKKLAKGKGLTYSEQEAMDWLKNQNIAPKTKYELAHELAQRNAALPVEQGGLGLLANNTAMERAKAMGFDTPAYHGTNADIKAFDPEKSAQGGITWYADNPAATEEFMNSRGGANIIPLMVNKGKTAGWKEYDQLGIDELAGRGYTSVYLPEKTGDSVGFVMNPNQLRSRFAAFDPLKRNSSDLLASLLPITTTGLLANQLRQSLWAEPQPD